MLQEIEREANVYLSNTKQAAVCRNTQVYQVKMTDTQANNTDKLVSLQKEAEGLKLRLEEERQKLSDITCK